MTPPVRAAWSRMPEGVTETVSPEGVPTFVAFTRMANPEWTIAVAVPKEMVTCPALRAALAQMGWTVLALVFGLVLARRVSASITAPLARLRQFAAAAKPADRDPEHALTGLPEADEVAEALLAETRQRNESVRRLIESEVRLRAIGEATPALLLAVDRESRLIYANPATLAMLGKPAEEVLGKLASEYHDDPRRGGKPAPGQPAHHGRPGRPRPARNCSPCPDGTRHLFLSTRAPMRDPASGRIVGVTVVSRDITEQHRAEAALAESEARFRALATATQEGVAIHDGERIVEANDAFMRMFGFASRAEMIGSPPIELNAPEARAGVLAKVAAGHAEPYETTGLRQDGSTFPMETHGQTILYQGRRLRVGVIRDLTRQKAAEAALRESEDRWRTLAEALPQMVWSAAPDGRVEYRNARWREFSGLDAAPDDSEAWHALIHPQDGPRILQRWSESLRSGMPLEIEMRMRHRDGSWRHVLARAVALTGFGRWHRAVVWLHDGHFRSRRGPRGNRSGGGAAGGAGRAAGTGTGRFRGAAGRGGAHGGARPTGGRHRARLQQRAAGDRRPHRPRHQAGQARAGESAGPSRRGRPRRLSAGPQ